MFILILLPLSFWMTVCIARLLTGLHGESFSSGSVLAAEYANCLLENLLLRPYGCRSEFLYNRLASCLWFLGCFYPVYKHICF